MIQIMKIGTDKWKHFGINYAICALLGNYGVPFALGASLGKEYGDKMSPGNKWDWKDILADLAGIVAGFDACMYRPDHNVEFSTLSI